MPITVLLVDDHELVRKALRAMLEAHDDIAVVAEAKDGASAIELSTRLAPDVVVMDIGLGDMSGLEVTRRLREGGEGPRVILLSASADGETAIASSKAGASAFLRKDEAFDRLHQAIGLAALGPR